MMMMMMMVDCKFSVIANNERCILAGEKKILVEK